MWFIGVEVEQETSAPPPKKNPGSTPVHDLIPKHNIVLRRNYCHQLVDNHLRNNFLLLLNQF